MDKNIIRASGRLVSIKKLSDHFSAVTIVVKNGRLSFPRMICSTSQAMKLKQMGVTHISIEGHIEGEKALTSSGKDIVKHTLIADTITAEETILEKEFQIKGQFYDNSSIRLAISGIIKKIDEKEDFRVFTIECLTESGKNIISAVQKKSNKIAKIKENDKICAVCKISTIKKGEQEKQKIYQDIIILDISKK